MRQIVFDTESTGFNAEGDDRVVEIGALEVVNFIPTGKTYHQYINPEREVPEGAVQVHGLTYDRLKTEPVFSEVYTNFLEFVGDSDLVAHNADFDMRFINAELKRVGVAPLHKSRAIDTLAIARKTFPGANNTLDALCRRFDVDSSERVLHGALLDAELLAEVYLELSGGRQQGLNLNKKNTENAEQNAQVKKIYPARVFEIPEAELKEFHTMVDGIDDALWSKKEDAA
jgi:DNA polymerase-3 subunit epsilon